MTLLGMVIFLQNLLPRPRFSVVLDHLLFHSITLLHCCLYDKLCLCTHFLLCFEVQSSREHPTCSRKRECLCACPGSLVCVLSCCCSPKSLSLSHHISLFVVVVGHHCKAKVVFINIAIVVICSYYSYR